MTPPENFAVTAKLFLTGGSQAVRLPVEFGFEGVTEVYIWRDTATGDVVLSRRPRPTWQDFMTLRAQLADSDLATFMSERQQAIQQRDPFKSHGPFGKMQG
jgi:antitoxin VapB